MILSILQILNQNSLYYFHYCILRSLINIILDIVVTYVIVFLIFTAHWKTT